MTGCAHCKVQLLGKKKRMALGFYDLMFPIFLLAFEIQDGGNGLSGLHRELFAASLGLSTGRT